jgi:hypothetical protein
VDVKLPQLPVSNSTYVVVAERELPRPETVMVAVDAVAVNLYHIP